MFAEVPPGGTGIGGNPLPGLNLPGNVQFLSATYNVDENVLGGLLTVTVVRNNGQLGTVAVDYATGTMGAFALAAALFQRERTGKGQHIDLAMLGVAMMMQASIAEDPRWDLWALLSPFLLVALPAMALTAALALIFETIPGLSGGAFG